MPKCGGTILVVDDEVDVLEMIEVGLGLDGYEVILADSGERAVELVTRRPVDLVISDLRMPGMNGVETIARLRELAPAVPVIVVTGYLAPGAVEDCMALGGVNLLRKPFRFKNLTHAVRSVLGPPLAPVARG
jgi:CheY-like chemotaxis protein